MRVALATKGQTGPLLLETPLVRAGVGSSLRVGIRAGDILLATSLPQWLECTECDSGTDPIITATRRDRFCARVLRLEMEVHLTLAARDSLQLAPGSEVWLVIKTHSCHLMQR